MVSVDEVKGHFGELCHVVLATQEGEHPRLRPVTLMHYNERLYFATNPASNKAKQLESNPNVEILYQWKEEPNNGYIRISGKVHKVSDIDLVSNLFYTYDFFKKLWSGPDDPSLIIYQIHVDYYDLMKPGEWVSVKIQVK